MCSDASPRSSIARRVVASTLGSLAAASALALTGLAALGAAQAPSSPRRAEPFTEDERAQLLAGELVRRPEQRRQGNATYIGGTSWQRVRAPRERVWRTILDETRYPRLIPGVDRAEVLEARGNRRVMFMRHSYLFMSVAYHARVRIQPSRYTIRFDLDRTRPRDIRDGRGFITLDRYGPSETIVTWGVMADVGSGILTGVFSQVIYDWILRVPYCVRGQLERGQGGC